MTQHLSDGSTRRGRLAGFRPPRILTVASLVVAIAVLPMVALASDRFSDVPNGHLFHNQINNIADAGITQGCSPTTYCPEANVTRGQMAAFLNRGLGRVASAEVNFQDVPADGDPIVSVTIESEGTEYILVQAGFYAFIEPGAAGAVYPCEHGFGIKVDDVSRGSSLTWIRTAAAPGAGDYHLDSMASQAVVPVDPGVHTVELYYQGETGGHCTLSLGRGSLSAQVVPFGGDGSGVSAGSTAGSTTDEGPMPANQP